MGAALPTVSLGPGRTALQLTAGLYHACARLDDGTVKCWGRNEFGQLGLGDTLHRGDGPGEMGAALPTESLGPGRTAMQLTAGHFHTCARRRLRQVLGPQRLRPAGPRRHAEPWRWPRPDGGCLAGSSDQVEPGRSAKGSSRSAASVDRGVAVARRRIAGIIQSCDPGERDGAAMRPGGCLPCRVRKRARARARGVTEDRARPGSQGAAPAAGNKLGPGAVAAGTTGNRLGPAPGTVL